MHIRTFNKILAYFYFIFFQFHNILILILVNNNLCNKVYTYCLIFVLFLSKEKLKVKFRKQTKFLSW